MDINRAAARHNQREGRTFIAEQKHSKTIELQHRPRLAGRE
jgi:hypothetical protein